MSTRGVCGFHKNGTDKITYNHSDSYPRELGNGVKKFISNHSIQELNYIFDKIILVDRHSKPSDDQINECKRYLDLGVSEQTEDDWYCLLRLSQGDLETYAKGLRYMIDDSNFIKESLFCEWGWIINLDKNVLEIYKGFQSCPNYNRYFTPIPTNDGGSGSFFYNCQLIKEVPLSEVNSFDINAFKSEIYINEEKNDTYTSIMKLVTESVPIPAGRVYTRISKVDVERIKFYYSKHIDVEIYSNKPLQSYIPSIKDSIKNKRAWNKTEIIKIKSKVETLDENWKHKTVLSISIEPMYEKKTIGVKA